MSMADVLSNWMVWILFTFIVVAYLIASSVGD